MYGSDGAGVDSGVPGGGSGGPPSKHRPLKHRPHYPVVDIGRGPYIDPVTGAI